METQQQGNTDSHIAIARKVAINLQGVAIHSHQILYARIKRRVIEDALYEVDTDIVGYHRLLEKTGNNEEDTPPEHLLRYKERLPDLRNEIPRTHNRPGYQLREERNVKSVIKQVRQRLDSFPVHIDGIA